VRQVQVAVGPAGEGLVEPADRVVGGLQSGGDLGRGHGVLPEGGVRVSWCPRSAEDADVAYS